MCLVFRRRHVVFAPSSLDLYSGSSFPGLTDSLFQIERASGEEADERWRKVRQQLSTVTYFVHAAAKFLRDFSDF